MIKDHPHLKSTFPEPPLLSFRRNKNLKDILIHSSLQSFTQYEKIVPCNHQSCLLCQSMSNTDTVKNPKSGLSFKTKGGNCCKSNIVYAAEFTYVLITTDLKSILERSLVNLSNISMTMVVTFVKICVFTFWKIICHFQRHLVSFVKTT